MSELFYKVLNVDVSCLYLPVLGREPPEDVQIQSKHAEALLIDR